MDSFESIKFNVSNKTVCLVDTVNSKFHDFNTYNELLQTAQEIRNNSVFSNVEIPDYKFFKPFSYQKNSIKIMLERFEGRGVFGDQVGLGKTIQVLITADLMFKYGEIKNCVIIAPKTLISQWKNEINSKLPDSFNIIGNEDGTSVNPFSNIKKIYDSQYTVDDKINTVFVDADKFTRTKDLAGGDKALDLKKEDAEKHIEDLYKEKEKNLNRIEEIKNSRLLDIKRWTNGGFTMEEIEEDNDKLPEIGKLRRTNKKYDEEIASLRTSLVTFEESKSLNKPIDLLIIDESHKVIDRIMGDSLGEKENAYSSYYNKMNKKYTILLSATPIEKNINDIYKLVRFVDKNRFASIDKFTSYVNGAKTLAELIKNDESIDRIKGLISSLFTNKRLYDAEVQDSLNRKFDLSVLVDVLNGEKDKAYTYANSISDIDKKKSLIKHLDKFYADSNHEKYISDICDFIHEQSYLYRHAYCKNPDQHMALETFLDDENIMTNYLNAYLCNYFKLTHLDFVFPFVDWRPSKKVLNLKDPIEVDLSKLIECNDSDTYQDEEIIKLLNHDMAIQFSKVIIYKCYKYSRLALMEKLHKAYPNRVILIDLDKGSFEQVINAKASIEEQKSKMKDFIKNDILSYSGLKSSVIDEIIENIIGSASKKGLVDKFYGNKRTMAEEISVYYKNKIFELFNSNAIELGNAIMLMDKTRFEGSDLHCASNIVLCQTRKPKDYQPKVYGDVTTVPTKDNDIPIDPLVLEQFVGRIFRIGQSYEAVVTVFSENAEDKYLFGEIYNDKYGFDIFGEGKNEIGFVVPIVNETWKKIIEENKVYMSLASSPYSTESFVGIYKNICLIERKMIADKNGKNLENVKLTFEDIVNSDLMKQFKEFIRNVCIKLRTVK